jgi:hypothetical protein
VQEERIPTFILGDVIAYVVTFVHPVNVDSVTAAFRNEATGKEIVLRGEARMIPLPRHRDRRTFAARLTYSAEGSERAESGDYRLARLEATTWDGKPLDFDNPPAREVASFRFEEEPADDDRLPRLIDAPFFDLEKGHPNTRPDSA